MTNPINRLPRWVWRTPGLCRLRRAAIAAAIRRELPAERKKKKVTRSMARMTGAISWDLSDVIARHYTPRNCRSVMIELDSSEPSTPPKPTLPPGRQPIAMGDWELPVPARAQCAPWADIHRFPKGVDRQRDPRATLVGEAPPLAMVCPACELEQPTLFRDRTCGYCGLKLKLHAPVVFWWREAVDVPEWKP